MADASKWSYIIPAAAAAGSAYLASRNARKDREAAAEENDLDRRYRAAVEETSLNPFRHQLAQGQTLGQLDVMANAQMTPARYSLPGITVPTIEGGFNYQPSADMRTSAKLLQRDVASGRTAPTMTDPNNYGQTGVVNLNRAASGAAPGGAQPRSGGGAVPGAGASRSAAAFDPSTLLAGYDRRNEGAGGVMSGMGKGALAGATVGKFVGPIGTVAGGVGGALVGGIVGAFTKNAKTAATDLSVNDARQVIRDAYATYLGREASPDEIEGQLAGIGFDKGRHQWVGEQGLMAIVRSIERTGATGEVGTRDAEYAGLFG